jgi:MarR family transcriptional regulator, negative regulator of the multidrug operon emrRAB
MQSAYIYQLVDERRRQENLLGTLSLAVTERFLGECRSEAAGSAAAAAALAAISTFLDRCSIEQLSRSLALSHSATVRLVDKLESRGDIERLPGSDRRSVAISLTAQGRTRAAGIRRARVGSLDELLEPLTESERRELSKLHEKLLAGIVSGGAAPARVCRLCDIDGCGHFTDCCPVTNAARALRNERAAAD